MKPDIPISAPVAARPEDEGPAPQRTCAGTEPVSGDTREEQAPLRSEARYRGLFEKSTSVMLLLAADSGAILDANEAAVGYYGYPRAALLAMAIGDIDDGAENSHQGTTETGGACRRTRHRLAGGEVRDVDLYATPIHSDGSDLLFVIIHDVTERVQVEAALRHSEQRLRDAEYIAKMGHWEVDLASDEVFWSPEFQWITGIDGSLQDGRSLLELLVHPADRRSVRGALRRVLAQGGEHETELRIVRPDGVERWLYCRARRLAGGVGQAARLSGIVQDITARKQSEERRRLSASVFDNTTEGITITDAAGKILEVNRAFIDITGYSRDEVVGRNPRILQSGRHDRAFYQAMWQSLLEAGRWRGEIWNRRKDGSVFPEWLTISRVLDPAGRVCNYVAVFSDISQVKQSQDQLDHLAHHDALTGLPNRLLLNEQLEHSIRLATHSGASLALVFLDFDHFKHVNESLGHPTGDRLLQAIARRLVGAVRHEDTVARIGGDEFAVLLEGIADESVVVATADKLMAAFDGTFEFSGHEITVTASMGICLFPRDGGDPHTLLRNADAAMYRAKSAGRNGYQFYTEELTRRVFERVLLENSLRKAVERDELHIVYQPQFELDGGGLIGLEALIRWRHPDLGLISPEKFIPLAEESDLIITIGRWVLHTVCAQGQAWLARGMSFGRIAVNIAGPQLQRGGLLVDVEAALRDTGLPAECLELEVTEGFIMRQAETAIAELDALRDRGVALAIDDFGTGYSSLSYLKRLPVHKLKIDKSFIRDIPEDSNDMAISAAVIAMGCNLGLTVIAEGVETELQAQFLREHGCHEAQGFLYARPLDCDVLEREFLDQAQLPGKVPRGPQE